MADTELITDRSRLISWQNPVALTAAAADLSGRDFLHAISEGPLPAPPMAELIGAPLASVFHQDFVKRALEFL